MSSRVKVPSHKPSEPQHVVMLVNNTCVNDSRVIKSAEAIAKTGRAVTIICRHSAGLPEEEFRNNVRYRRIAPIPFELRNILDRLRNAFDAPASNSGSLTGTFIGSVSKILLGLLFNAFLLVYKILRFFSSNLRRVFEFIRTIGRSLTRGVKGLWRSILRKTYQFIEADEFMHAAEPHVLKLRPDVIHAHDLTTLPLGGRVARKVGSSLIYDSHELEMHRNATYTNIVKWKRRRLEKKYIRQAESVITVSDSIADHLRQDYSIKRPNVIFNSPDFVNSKDKTRTLRGDLGFTPEIPLAVYVGSVTINRGLEEMVRALQYSPQLRFALVGPRRPATESALRMIIDEIAVVDRVYFIDPVPPEAVVNFISDASVSVLPIQNVCLSYYYCMPNKLLESVFAGLPVVVANLFEMARFVENNKCGLVADETSPEDIARAIDRVLMNRGQYVLSKESRNELAREFGWDSQARRLQKIYDEIGH